jgi:hypothetical protein
MPAPQSNEKSTGGALLFGVGIFLLFVAFFLFIFSLGSSRYGGYDKTTDTTSPIELVA